jgi:hypothetical protein
MSNTLSSPHIVLTVDGVIVYDSQQVQTLQTQLPSFLQQFGIGRQRDITNENLKKVVNPLNGNYYHYYSNERDEDGNTLIKISKLVKQERAQSGIQEYYTRYVMSDGNHPEHLYKLN